MPESEGKVDSGSPRTLCLFAVFFLRTIAQHTIARMAIARTPRANPTASPIKRTLPASVAAPPVGGADGEKCADWTNLRLCVAVGVGDFERLFVGLGVTASLGLGVFDSLGLGDFDVVGVGDLEMVWVGDFDTVGLGDVETLAVGVMDALGDGDSDRVGVGDRDPVGLGEFDSDGEGEREAVDEGDLETVDVESGDLVPVGLWE